MLTYGELLAKPKRLSDLRGADVLIAAAGAGEVVIQGAPAQAPEATMVFMHETIQMMRAERAEKLEKLRAEIGPKSVVVPIVKKPTSFWDQITVGRASTADIVLDDPAASNVHAHFIIEGEGQPVYLRDVGSSNGTYVNRSPLQPHQSQALTSGDCIRIGQSIFYYLTFMVLTDLIDPSDDD